MIISPVYYVSQALLTGWLADKNLLFWVLLVGQVSPILYMFLFFRSHTFTVIAISMTVFINDALDITGSALYSTQPYIADLVVMLLLTSLHTCRVVFTMDKIRYHHTFFLLFFCHHQFSCLSVSETAVIATPAVVAAAGGFGACLKTIENVSTPVLASYVHTNVYSCDKHAACECIGWHSHWVCIQNGFLIVYCGQDFNRSWSV